MPPLPDSDYAPDLTREYSRETLLAYARQHAEAVAGPLAEALEVAIDNLAWCVAYLDAGPKSPLALRLEDCRAALAAYKEN